MTAGSLGAWSSFERRARAFVEKVAYRLGVWTPRRLDEAVSAFIAANARYWPAVEARSSGAILIEGHLAEYGPNYLFRTAVAAKALAEVRGLDIDVVFNGFTNRWTTAKRVYRSFGIGNFVFLGSRLFIGNLWRRVVSAVFALRTTRGLKSPDDILRIAYGGIRVGDLIYDDVLKLCGNETIERVDADVRRAVANSYFFYLQYQALFASGRYRYYVSTHTAYSEYGILCRVALAHGIPVIETTDIQMSYYTDDPRKKLPTYHDGIRSAIVNVLEDAGTDAEGMYAAAEEALKKRLASQIQQLDAQKAFRGRTYTREGLRETLGLGDDRKIAFVLAHVFSDAPHLSSGMLHADYFRWLSSTLEVCARAVDVIWVVKPHPSSELYGERGTVEGMVAWLGAENVRLCPPDLNTRSLERCADALVTVHGTAGLEFSCVGIPVVLAGKPFYSGFGFSIEPASVAEYEHALLGLKNVVPLTSEQRRRAILVYGIWERQFDWHNPIVTADVLANVWGSERPRNLEAAYHIMARNLRSEDPRRIRLWTFAQSIVNGG
jgi:hypothetical protein